MPQAREKDSQAVPVIQVVPILQQEPTILVVSPQPNFQAPAGEFSVSEDRSGLPQAEVPCEEERSPTSTLTSLEDIWAPPRSLISETDSQGFGETTAETLQEEEMHVDNIGKESEPDTQEGHSASELCEKEKAEVKSKIQPCPDVNTLEVTELMTPAVEERAGTCDSETPKQVLSPQSTAAPSGVERDHLKAEIKSTPLVQEMNVGFLTTAGPASSEAVDLKIPQDSTPITAESTEGQDLIAEQTSDSTLERNEEGSESREVCSPALEPNLEVNSRGNLKKQDRAVLQVESTEERQENLQANDLLMISTEKKFEEEIEKETQIKVEELIDPITPSQAHNEGSNMNESEEPMNVANPDGNESHLVVPTEGIPQIQISTIEDIPDIKLSGPDEMQNQQIIIPRIEVMEPEIRECTLPPAVLVHNKPESEPPVFLQKHNATEVCEVTIKEHNVSDDSTVTVGLLPKRRGMRNDHNLLPTEKVKEVAQLDDETGTLEHKQPDTNSREQLPRMDFASIPVINVSCSDDATLREAVDEPVQPRVSDTPQPSDTPAVPLFVVSPVSVICHESAPAMLPNKSEWTGTETLALMIRGTKYDTGNNMTTHPEKAQNTKQKLEEMAPKKVAENTPAMPYEALRPNIGTSVLTLSKTTEDNIVPEILRTKPLKEAKTESYISAEDLQRNRSSVERLGVKSPTHPPLSPASLRKFMSKAATDSDTDAVTGVPVITVTDRQSDKAEEDRSGGSTPTSSLSCESSPRLKRRDSLSLIRSATPEELASGARRKIFIPKTKGEDGEGTAAGLGALDIQGKKETPYMSPGQARRAALLQAPPGQNTPPMERRSPLLSRRRATLDVPKVVEEIPTEVPASTKKDEKPAEKKLDPLKGKIPSLLDLITTWWSSLELVYVQVCHYINTF